MSRIEVEVVPQVSRRGDLSASRPAGPEPLGSRGAELADGVATIADQFRGRMDQLEADEGGRWSLEKVTLEFALALKAEAGILVTKASAGTTFTATITWSARDRTGAP